MRASEMTDETAEDCRIAARPPLTEPPFDRKESLPVSRIRVCVGLVLLVHHLRCWRPKFLLPYGQGMGVCRLCSANRVQLWVLGLHRLRSAGRDPRKLYGHQRI
jgi:hypothetical protein